MTKRNFILKILLVCCALCTSLALSLSLFKVKASAADSELPSVQTIAMMSGAQVRKESGTAGSQTDLQQAKGIRFRLYINQSYFESVDEVGVYVALASEATAEDMKAETTADENAKWLFTATDTSELVALEAGEETQEAVYVLNAVVANPPEADYNTQLIANGYAEVNGEKTFASEPQQRSVAQVASLALLDGEGVTTGDGADDPHGTLNHYVNTVATAEGFDFANAAITTDKYKTANPDVGAELPENLKAKWESSNEAVATVDGEGVITRVGEGETTITAILGTTTKSATVTIGAPAPLKITSEADEAMVIDGRGFHYTYVAAGDDEIKDFEGGYDGAALKNDAGGSAALHNLYSAYTKEELTEIAKDYNKVTFWFAINGGADKAADNTGSLIHYKNDNTVETLALGLTANKNYKITDGGKWTKWALSINDYISLLTEEVEDGVPTGKSYVSLYQSWASNFATNPSMYLGDVEFVLDTYAFNAAEDLSLITDSNFSYAKDSDIAAFSGGYDGKAVVKNGINTNTFLTNKFSAADLEWFYTNGYTKVSMWIAMDNMASANVMTYTSSKGFLGKVYAENKSSIARTTQADNGAWKKYTITIESYISLFGTLTTAETTGAPTVAVTGTTVQLTSLSNNTAATALVDRDESATCDYLDVGIYFGNIVFEKASS